MDDVLIVGAGPAGAVAAIVLARGGARVRLLDRAVFPRDKLCGDTVNPGSAKCRFNRVLRALVASPAAVLASTMAVRIVPGPLSRLVAAAGDCGTAATKQRRSQ